MKKLIVWSVCFALGGLALSQGKGKPEAAKMEIHSNSLQMKFVPVPGTKVLFSIWDVRVRDYTSFAHARAVDDSWTKQQFNGVAVSREPDFPVVGVSWNEAQDFCRWL